MVGRATLERDTSMVELTPNNCYTKAMEALKDGSVSIATEWRLLGQQLFYEQSVMLFRPAPPLPMAPH